jgi:hypothetical protein
VERAGGETVVVGPGDPQPIIEPTDRVVLTAQVEEGCTGDPDEPFEALRLVWSIDGPGRKPSLLTVPGRPERRLFEPEQTGRFTVGLAVEDSLGLEAEPVSLPLDVRFMRDIAVEMSWPDGADVDLDLHLVRGPAQLFDPVNDAYFGNYDARTGVGPNWGGGGAAGDPLLLFDDQGSSRRLETITLDGAEPGQYYSVYVQFFEDRRQRTGAAACDEATPCAGSLVCSDRRCMPPVEALVQNTLRGEVVEGPAEDGVLRRTLDAPCDTWLVGRIQWPAAGGAPTFVPASIDNYPDCK